MKLITATLLFAAFCPPLRAAGVELPPERPVVAWQGRTMGSPYTVQITGIQLTDTQMAALRNEVESRLEEINRQMSNYQPESELSQFNRAPAHIPFKISSEFAQVVRAALDMSRRSEGAFDPTLGPVINLWGFGEKPGEHVAPETRALQTAKQQTGWKHLTLTEKDELVKDLDNLSLDLGGVAKGYAVDQMGQVLHRHGLTNFYVSIAGEVLVAGQNRHGLPWHLGISAPVDHWRDTDPMAAGVRLSDQALSTSGDYQKFFRDAQGVRQSHIIDPRTGSPVQHNLAGVSVVASESMTADALGTTLFVLGLEEGMKFIDSWTNASALFIVRESEGNFRQIPSGRFSRMTGYTP